VSKTASDSDHPSFLIRLQNRPFSEPRGSHPALTDSRRLAAPDEQGFRNAANGIHFSDYSVYQALEGWLAAGREIAFE